MNKLDIAIKLLQLLNERKKINSRIVADELNVSLRTAQRYLREVSAMPCVIVHDNNSDYSLLTDYKLKDALVNPSDCEVILNKLQNNNHASCLHKVICLVCGKNGGNISQNVFVFDQKDSGKLSKLISTIELMLKDEEQLSALAPEESHDPREPRASLTFPGGPARN